MQNVTPASHSSRWPIHICSRTFFCLIRISFANISVCEGTWEISYPVPGGGGPWGAGRPGLSPYCTLSSLLSYLPSFLPPSFPNFLPLCVCLRCVRTCAYASVHTHTCRGQGHSQSCVSVSAFHLAWDSLLFITACTTLTGQGAS